MPKAALTISGLLGGLSFRGTIVRTADGQLSEQVLLPAATAGTLALRTADDEATFVLPGHCLVVHDVVDVYWPGGIRYGIQITAVSGDEITAGGIGSPGDGDPLPPQETAVNVAKQIPISMQFDPDNAVMIIAHSNKRAHVDFQGSDGMSVMAYELPADEPWCWCFKSGFAVPMIGGPVKCVKASNGDVRDATLQIAVLKNSV